MVWLGPALPKIDARLAIIEGANPDTHSSSSGRSLKKMM
jgi:hypothetical protein